jgi:hypothetical protein
MTVALPDVTFVMFDATCPELARLALEDSLSQADFGDVIVCSPEPERIAAPGHRQIKTPVWKDRLSLCEFMYYELPDLVHTKFLFNFDYDSWIIDASMWTSEFLEYDYGGPPWWYADDFNVGHGRLRSLRLMRFLAANRERFPLVHPEDDTLSRKYRPALEREGFRWMPEPLASRFGFECTRPSPTSKHFMFHDVFNFPAVLNGVRLMERLRLMLANPYLQKSNKLTELFAGRQAMIMPRLQERPNVVLDSYTDLGQSRAGE